MPVLVEDTLIMFYKQQYDKLMQLKAPDSFQKPTSYWIDKRTAIHDMYVFSELNSMLTYLKSKNGKDIAKQIEIQKFYNKIMNCHHKTLFTPRGRSYIMNHREELTKVLIEMNEEFNEKRGKIFRFLEKKINDMRPNLGG